MSQEWRLIMGGVWIGVVGTVIVWALVNEVRLARKIRRLQANLRPGTWSSQ